VAQQLSGRRQRRRRCPRRSPRHLRWRVLLHGVHDSSPRVGAVGHSWAGRRNFLLHHEILQSFGAVLDDPHHHAERGNKQKLEAWPLPGVPNVGEEISPAGWRIAPALNPKERRGLSILLATSLVDQHTRARKGLEWFRLPKRNTLLHCVMYCLGACMNLRVSA
jgi:hypothetical protein